MKEHNRFEDTLIDEFYKEGYVKINDSIKHSEDYIKFKEKLQSSSEKLDVLNQGMFDISIDTMSIIEQAETMMESRKLKKESILFISVSVMLLALYGSLSFLLGPNVILISQILILALVPWFIIPIAIVKRKGSEA